MLSWVNLERIFPQELEISEIIRKAKLIDNELSFTPNLEELDKYKTTLLKTKADIEILIADIVSFLQNPELQKTVLDNVLYELLKRDLAGYIGLIDERQNQLVEVHDGENLSGVGRTMAFRGVLLVALHGIIYGSLYDACTEYNNTPDTFNIKDKRIKKKTTTSKDSIEETEEYENFEREERRDLSTFTRILFHVLSIKLAVLGGLERRKTMSKSGYSGLSSQNWKASYTKPGVEKIANAYKEETGQDIKDEIMTEKDLFEDEGGEDASESTE